MRSSTLKNRSKLKGGRRFPFGGVALFLLITAVVFGGGGSHAAFGNLIVGLGALLAICWFAFRREPLSHRYGRAFAILVAATIALPLLQLIPLPAGLWQALPGRDLAVEARGLVGAGEQWFAHSLDRGRTLGALAALLVPLGLLLALDLDRTRKRASLLLVVVGLGLAHFLLGGLQIILGNVSFFGYPNLVDGQLYGFFANHNSAGLFFVLALCALAAVADSDFFARRKWMMWVAGVLLSLGCVLTQSRSSLALLILVLFVLAARTLWSGRLSAHRPRPALLGGIGIALVLAVGLLATNTRTLQTFERFENFEDSRPDIWADTLIAVDRYWPVGSGMGTFDEVFQIDESLETLVAQKAGRAHNDFLEISLEAGVPGILLVFAWLVWLGIAWWRTRETESGRLVSFSALALLCIALQSLIDYPLRNYAMWSLVAGFAAVLAAANVNSRGLNLAENP